MAPRFPSGVRVLLCDADDSLFPSEKHAFDASCEVTNAFLSAIGSERRFEPDELRLKAAGRNFRATATALALQAGTAIEPAELDRWVIEEQRRVTAHLASVLRPDPAVTEPLTRLAARFRLAVVSSSATPRLDACFEASGLDELFPRALRFSAADSLPTPTSKPDPAVYRFAAEVLGVTGDQAVAVEDSLAGVQSAVAAGIRTVGNVAFIAGDERAERIDVLGSAGADPIVSSWHELEALLCPPSGLDGQLQAIAAAERL